MATHSINALWLGALAVLSGAILYTVTVVGSSWFQSQ